MILEFNMSLKKKQAYETRVMTRIRSLMEVLVWHGDFWVARLISIRKWVEWLAQLGFKFRSEHKMSTVLYVEYANASFSQKQRMIGSKDIAKQYKQERLNFTQATTRDVQMPKNKKLLPIFKFWIEKMLRYLNLLGYVLIKHVFIKVRWI